MFKNYRREEEKCTEMCNEVCYFITFFSQKKYIKTSFTYVILPCKNRFVNILSGCE